VRSSPAIVPLKESSTVEDKILSTINSYDSELRAINKKVNYQPNLSSP
jgi:hypothetical protein